MNSGTMYCNACGTGLSDQARYCSSCGRAVAYPHCTSKLMRPRFNRKIAGVCSGLSEHLGLDTSLVRILWVFLTFASGFFPGLIAYILAWIIIPRNTRYRRWSCNRIRLSPDEELGVQDHPSDNVRTMDFQPGAREPRTDG